MGDRSEVGTRILPALFGTAQPATSRGPMNLLHVSTATSWRGGEQQIAYLLEELGKKNISQIVCCPVHSPLHRFCETLPVPVLPFESRGFAGIPLARTLRDAAIQKNISVIHAHDS